MKGYQKILQTYLNLDQSRLELVNLEGLLVGRSVDWVGNCTSGSVCLSMCLDIPESFKARGRTFYMSTGLSSEHIRC